MSNGMRNIIYIAIRTSANTGRHPRDKSLYKKKRGFEYKPVMESGLVLWDG